MSYSLHCAMWLFFLVMGWGEDVWIPLSPRKNFKKNVEYVLNLANGHLVGRIFKC